MHSKAKITSDWDHPRRCGAYSMPLLAVHLHVGSPPQVRGIPVPGTSYDAAGGITPAGAGHTLLKRLIRIAHRDHPRRCGAYAYIIPYKDQAQGSPPQVRGIHLCRYQQILVNGITPAGAGHTATYLATSITGRDHPRRCGAYYHYRRQQNQYLRDHPRRCGAYSTVAKWQNHSMGSPPQVRGIPVSIGIVSFVSGITPAGAGHTIPQNLLDVRRWDHPRRCGAYKRFIPKQQTCQGSPPQVRGIPSLR